MACLCRGWHASRGLCLLYLCILTPSCLAIICGHDFAKLSMDSFADGTFWLAVGKVAGFASGKVFKASVCGLLEFVFCIAQFCAQLPNRNVSGGQCAAVLLAGQRHHGAATRHSGCASA